MNDEPWDDFLRRLADGIGPLAQAVADGLSGLLFQGIAPVLAAAVVFLDELKEHCPEAYDAAGNLRPDWQAIVQAKMEMLASAPVPELHVELATRAITVFLN